MNLELKHVNKSFGDNKVLTDISFKVESGRAFGFLGRNLTLQNTRTENCPLYPKV